MVNNYKKYYLRNKKEGFMFSRDVSIELGISLKKVQTIAWIIGVKKDSSDMYMFTEEDIEKMKQLLSRPS